MTERDLYVVYFVNDKEELLAVDTAFEFYEQALKHVEEERKFRTFDLRIVRTTFTA